MTSRLPSRGSPNTSGDQTPIGYWAVDGNTAGSKAETPRPTCLIGLLSGRSSWWSRRSFRLGELVGVALGGDHGQLSRPDRCRIERLGDGSPQGTLHEGAMDLMSVATPMPGRAELAASLLESQTYLFSLGITAWQDAWIDPTLHEVYKDLADAGDLKAAVRGCLWWERDRGVEQLQQHIEHSQEGVGTYDPRTVKLMLDGVCENHTAAMLEPYIGAPDGGTPQAGLDFIDPAELNDIVTKIDAAGLQCHFHALGDRAVRNALAQSQLLDRPTGSMTRVLILRTSSWYTPMTFLDSASWPRLPTLNHCGPCWMRR